MNVDFPVISRLPPYVFSIIGGITAQLRSQGVDVINFGMGNPDGMPPAQVVEKMIQAAQKPKTHGYSQSRGIPRLRKAMANWYMETYGVHIDPESQVTATIGSKEGLAHLISLMFSDGATLLTPNPSYPVHVFSPLLCGADLRHFPLGSQEEMLVGIEQAIAACTPKPRGIIVNFPANPTGLCVDLVFFEKLIALAKEQKIWVIHDLAYADIGFDGYRPPSILQVPGADEIAVEFFTLSKSFNMAGWRLGFCCGNKSIIAALSKFKSYHDYGTFTPLQVAAIEALENQRDFSQGVAKIYQQRRDELCNGLHRIGWQVDVPKAGMYVWAKIPEQFSHVSSVDFATRLVNTAAVATSPGVGFGSKGEGYVRFALVENIHRIRQAVQNIKRSWTQLGESK